MLVLGLWRRYGYPVQAEEERRESIAFRMQLRRLCLYLRMSERNGQTAHRKRGVETHVQKATSRERRGTGLYLSAERGR